jgi:hypothetical protein
MPGAREGQRGGEGIETMTDGLLYVAAALAFAMLILFALTG